MFYKQACPRVHPETGEKYRGYSAYDHSDTIAEAVEAYKRCRKSRTFILTDDAPELDTLECSVCGRILSDYGDAPKGYRGNYIDYSPRSRTFRAKHYMCAWNTLLGAICTSYSVAEAGAKYERMVGPARRV